MMLVKELMSGLSEIPVVDGKATLFEAVLQIGLDGAKPTEGGRYPAVLVVDEGKRVAGFLEFRSMLLAFAPGYGEFARSAGQTGLSPDAMGAELQKLGLLEDALLDLCKKAAETPISSVMTIPGPDRITRGDVSISEAAYRMAVSAQDYLFVLDGEVLEGIISLSDIMAHICDTVRACRV